MEGWVGGYGAHLPLWRLMNVLADIKVAGRDKRLSDRMGGRYGQKAIEGWSS